MIATKANPKAGIILLAALHVAALAVPLAVMASAASAQAAGGEANDDKRWLAVAPGRVEPVSGQVRLAASAMGVIDRVLVNANDTVLTGEPLVRLLDAEARAQLASAEAQAALRQRVRNKESTPSGAGPRRRAEDAVADSEDSVFELRGLLDKAMADKRAGKADADVEAARKALARAQERLALQTDDLRRITADAPLPTVAEGQLNAARADLQAARATLEKLTIRAPMDGTILQMNARRGELASPQAVQPLVLMGDMSSLRVRAEVDERDIEKIKLGQATVVRSAAFRGRDIGGKVSFVAQLVQTGRNNTLNQRSMSDVDVVEVLVDLSEPGPLVAGMKVDVYFQQDSAAK
jgi:HlyD family secretion protein